MTTPLDINIKKAFWQDEQTGIIILEKDWLSPKPPTFSLQSGLKINNLSTKDSLFWANLSNYYIQNDHIIFLLSEETYPEIKHIEDPIYVAGDFNNWGEAIPNDKWEMRPKQINGLKYLLLECNLSHVFKEGSEEILFKFVTLNNLWLHVHSDKINALADGNNWNYSANINQTGKNVFVFKTKNHDIFKQDDFLIWKDASGQKTQHIYSTIPLLKLASNKPLGVIVQKDKTTFRIFAPRAQSVKVQVLNQPNDQSGQEFQLLCNQDKTWETTVDSNLSGRYYYYYIQGGDFEKSALFNPHFKILDPYAKAVVHAAGPGIILDDTYFKTKKSTFKTPSKKDLVILEVHVRDLLAKANTNISYDERLGFKGLTKWIQDEASYLRNLGINAVELQPIQEFDSQSKYEYHWGYMPVNYFSPESTYATNPEKATQIQEFKDLVEAFHKAGIAVIMDVVYNHVGNPNALLHIDKEYYFETNTDYYLMNYSGCGNDLRCNTPMAKRLIIESLLHFITVYNVDGFRFDLAELLGIEVLQEIETEIKKVKKSTILIAEPWSFRGNIVSELKHTDYSSWNDAYRNFLPDYVKGNGNTDGLRYFLWGSKDFHTKYPEQSVNYVESHDDFCWLDTITENQDNNAEYPTVNDIKRTHMMFAILMTSLGIPMLAQGQDFLRSKKGNQNTYQNGTLNALDYDQLLLHSQTAQYFRSWIDFRLSKHGKLFRVDKDLPRDYIKFYTSKEGSALASLYNGKILTAFNPHKTWSEIRIDCDLTKFTQIADIYRFSLSGLSDFLIPKDKHLIKLPPISCALWILS